MRRRRGVALIAALVLLGILSLLIAGGVALVTASGRSANLSAVQSALSADADYALGVALGNSASFVDLPVGTMTPVSVGAIDPSVQVAASATRLSRGVLWLVGDARATGPAGGHRRFGLVARFPGPVALPPAPLVAAGAIVARDGVTILADTSHDAECALPAAPPAVLPVGMNASLPDAAAPQLDPRAADSLR